jgi:hypothetical protein
MLGNMTDSDLPALPSLPLGPYRHYKGMLYEVLGVVRHSETLEPLVLYRAEYGERGLWVRPFAMFTENVVIDGVQQARFTAILS